MVEYHSPATVLAILKSRLDADSDPLDWIGTEIATINREISNVRKLLHELGERRRAPDRRRWRLGSRLGRLKGSHGSA